jgi:hypothetical protein
MTKLVKKVIASPMSLFVVQFEAASTPFVLVVVVVGGPIAVSRRPCELSFSKIR